MKHSNEHGWFRGMWCAFGRQAAVCVIFLVAACSSGGDSESEPNTPLSTPMALVVNQDDTTLTTLRLDGKNSPVISTLSLGPAQSDAIGGVAFSLGEWIFVAHTAENRVATIDPIGGLTPILEDFLDASGTPRVGERPQRIYRDPTDKEVLWVVNGGDPVDGTDSGICGPTAGISSYTVLHNSHLSVGGEKPRVVQTLCRPGTGEGVVTFSRPTVSNPAIPKLAFMTSKARGKIAVIGNDPADTAKLYRTSPTSFVDLCDTTKETPCIRSSPNASIPTEMEWSGATGKVYVHLSGYRSIVEIDPAYIFPTSPPIVFPNPTGRTVDLSVPPFDNVSNVTMSITPDGRFLFLVGEDILADLIPSPPSGNVCQADPKVYGRFAIVDLTASMLSVQPLSVPQLDNIRPAQFRFTPDGRRLYLTQSNKINDLPCATQANNLKTDKLLVFDSSTLSAVPPAAPAFIAEVDLPPVGSDGLHGMDVWATGPHGAGSAKGVVVSNAMPGVNGSVSLINAASNTITATIAVGKNPKQVTVYYVGLAASDNQATPIW
jgi:YVTN family beta-propeller protein